MDENRNRSEGIEDRNLDRWRFWREGGGGKSEEVEEEEKMFEDEGEIIEKVEKLINRKMIDGMDSLWRES